jgi:ergothioneine biosynthesis protein EgtB
MPDASPIRWHLAHTTWFFETFVLLKAKPQTQAFDPHFQQLFNSYYNAIGEPFPRAKRGMLSRPTVAKVMEYRPAIDRQVGELLREFESAAAGESSELAALIELGINHEQQHQELMVTDLKHLFSRNPMRPAYRQRAVRMSPPAAALSWIHVEEGVYEIGHAGPAFAYDNEGPRHRELVQSCEIADRLITNAEYAEFIEDGGYRRPELWLSEGWATVRENAWCGPLYWEQQDRAWRVFTLAGMQPVNSGEPVCHVSFFEADAFARWKGARLPTEFQWEAACQRVPFEGNFAESEEFHPIPLATQNELDAGARILSRTPAGPQPLTQMFGDVWEWTASPYIGYPGYRPPEGAVGEYNGKFMCNQYVLRGGSCATPQSHIRRTYRNFFPPAARWQFTGLRLARDS